MRGTRIKDAVFWAAVSLAIDGAVMISYAGPPLPERPHGDAGARYYLGPGAGGRELNNGANLSDLDLRGMMLYGSNHFYSHVNFNHANLCGGCLEGEDNLSTKFRNCTFRNALMRRIQAEWVIDDSCDLTDADICGSRIVLDGDQLQSTASYKNKDLSYVKMYLLGIEPGFSLAGFNLRGTEFIIVDERARQRFAGVDLGDAEIAGASLSLTAEQLQSTKNYRRKDLGDITLTGNFRGVSFREFNLRNTTFRFCNLAGCDFTDADIWGMSVSDPVPYSTSAENHESPFTGEQVYATANYRRRDLDCVEFTGCTFRNVDFSNQTLGYFERCNLEGADFTNADHITGPSDDEKTDFRSFRFRMGFHGCNLSAEQFYSTRLYGSKRFKPGCSMSDMDLRGWDFSDFDLRHVSFNSSMVENARFENARGGSFRYAKGLTRSQVKSMWNFKHDKMHLNSEFSLPGEIVHELAEEGSRDD